jgi:hypothetical protein
MIRENGKYSVASWPLPGKHNRVLIEASGQLTRGGSLWLHFVPRKQREWT